MCSKPTDKTLTVEISFNYVLVLEWLDDDEERTGTVLYSFLLKLGIPAVLVRCESATHVREAIERATSRVPTHGHPIIHIEAHGSRPEDNLGITLGTRHGVALEWADLGDWFAPLNIASDFRLLVVGATCYGLGAIAALKVNTHAAPFVGCIGFSTAVRPGSLREAMKEFYRSLKRDDDLLTALANANRELRSGEKLELTFSPKLAYRILRGVYDEIRTPEASLEKVRKLIDTIEAAGLHVEASFEAAMPALLEERTRVHSQLAWDRWFPREVQDRSSHYRLDWSIVEMDLS